MGAADGGCAGRTMGDGAGGGGGGTGRIGGAASGLLGGTGIPAGFAAGGRSTGFKGGTTGLAVGLAGLIPGGINGPPAFIVPSCIWATFFMTNACSSSVRLVNPSRAPLRPSSMSPSSREASGPAAGSRVMDMTRF